MDLEQVLNDVEQGVANTADTTGKTFEIYVKNANSSAKTSTWMTAQNTLQQVFEQKAEELGFNVKKTNNIYINEDTSQSTSDSSLTMQEFQVKEHTLITIDQDGKVAGNRK